MKVIEPSFEILKPIKVKDSLKRIEQIGRVCYKSEDKITNDSYKPFIKNIIERKHYSVLEHVYYTYLIEKDTFIELLECESFDKYLPYIKLTTHLFKDWPLSNTFIISLNLRTLLEMYSENYKLSKYSLAFIKRLSWPIVGFLSDINVIDDNELNDYDALDIKNIKILCIDFDNYKKQNIYDRHNFVTVKFICDRGVTHELVRHRMASYAQESTRYANYSKDKFGNELTFIKPCFWTDELDEKYKRWLGVNKNIEDNYMKFLEENCTPQEARDILSISLKTEIFMTCNIEEWKHVFNLRCDKSAHPQIRELMIPLKEEFIKRGLI